MALTAARACRLRVPSRLSIPLRSGRQAAACSGSVVAAARLPHCVTRAAEFLPAPSLHRSFSSAADSSAASSLPSDALSSDVDVRLQTWNVQNPRDRAALPAAFVPTLYFQLHRLGRMEEAARLLEEHDELLPTNARLGHTYSTDSVQSTSSPQLEWTDARVIAWLEAFRADGAPPQLFVADSVWQRYTAAYNRATSATARELSADIRSGGAEPVQRLSSTAFAHMLCIHQQDGTEAGVARAEAMWQNVRSRCTLGVREYAELISSARKHGLAAQEEAWIARARAAGVQLPVAVRSADAGTRRDALLAELASLTQRAEQSFPVERTEDHELRRPRVSRVSNEFISMRAQTKQLLRELHAFAPSASSSSSAPPLSWSSVSALLDTIRALDLYEETLPLWGLVARSVAAEIRGKVEHQQAQHWWQKVEAARVRAEKKVQPTAQLGSADVTSPMSTKIVDSSLGSAAFGVSNGERCPVDLVIRFLNYVALGASSPRTVSSGAQHDVTVTGAEAARSVLSDMMRWDVEPRLCLQPHATVLQCIARMYPSAAAPASEPQSLASLRAAVDSLPVSMREANALTFRGTVEEARARGDLVQARAMCAAMETDPRDQATATLLMRALLEQMQEAVQTQDAARASQLCIRAERLWSVLQASPELCSRSGVTLLLRVLQLAGRPDRMFSALNEALRVEARAQRRTPATALPTTLTPAAASHSAADEQPHAAAAASVPSTAVTARSSPRPLLLVEPLAFTLCFDTAASSPASADLEGAAADAFARLVSRRTIYAAQQLEFAAEADLQGAQSTFERFQQHVKQQQQMQALQQTALA